MKQYLRNNSTDIFNVFRNTKCVISFIYGRKYILSGAAVCAITFCHNSEYRVWVDDTLNAKTCAFLPPHKCGIVYGIHMLAFF